MAVRAPDDVTAAAIKRLRQDPDFAHVTGWLTRELQHQDKANRQMVDGVPLRMGQGTAHTLDQIIGFLEGKVSGALTDTRIGAGPIGRSDTA